MIDCVHVGEHVEVKLLRTENAQLKVLAAARRDKLYEALRERDQLNQCLVQANQMYLDMYAERDALEKKLDVTKGALREIVGNSRNRQGQIMHPHDAIRVLNALLDLTESDARACLAKLGDK